MAKAARKPKQTDEAATAGAAPKVGPVKIYLPFEDAGPRNRFFSKSFTVPTGRRLLVEEVNVFVQLHETTDRAPVKAIAYLMSPVAPGASGHGPIGVIDWLDKSAPPSVDTTEGILRVRMVTFFDSLVTVAIKTNELLELAVDAGGVHLSHVIIVGQLVKRPLAKTSA